MTQVPQLAELVDRLGRLPGIGPRSANRIAFWLLQAPDSHAEGLAAAISDARRKVTRCPTCFGMSQDGEECVICADPRRDRATVCVVEGPSDVVAVERGGEYQGRYHVLGGAFSPIDGIGESQLAIGELRDRITAENITEVIVATNPTMEGEATAVLLQRRIAPMGVQVTRLASGLPAGGDIEHADEITLGRAFAGRTPIAG